MINLTQTLLAFGEGLGLAFSPCILPVLPLIFAASAVGGRWRPLQIIIGFILSFTFFSLISRQLLIATGLRLDQIQSAAYFFLLVFGLVMIIPLLEAKFAAMTNSIANKAQQASKNRFSEQTGGALLVGALIGIVWTPCSGPILAIALLQVIQAQTNWQAIGIILAFGIGAGIPMLTAGYFGRIFSQQLTKLTRHTTAIRRSMGVLIIIFALFGLSGFNVGEWVATRNQATEQIVSQDKLLNGLTLSYPAPEISGISNWINSPPLTIEKLKGKVVLVDFWTYSCINCIRTLPYIKSWYQKYKDNGLVVIGVHSPEFVFEQDLDNVKQAVKKFGITYPVALDNQFATWRNYTNHYWPAHYLIDRNGQVVYIHFGEGEYDITENNIRYLLNLSPQNNLNAAEPPISREQTPETYLGTARAQNQSSALLPPLHHWALQGSWLAKPQYIEAKSAGAAITLHYQAQKVFLVIANGKPTPGKITVLVSGKEKELTITENRLYEIVSNSNMVDADVTIKAQSPGIRLFAFTFESSATK
ncbi:cytochrome c biogenesis protein DipZ [Legionella dresdenensis]|uniref:Cytochrome c biogenesis protein DipZ n=1 Tax=Legionella dresdenensis TaxID=450200 RepID=A0ABV8CDM8_9GAMM